MFHSCQHLHNFLAEASKHTAGDTKYPKIKTEAGCKVKGKLGILFLWRWEDRMCFYAEWKNPIEDDRLMKQQKKGGSN